MKKFGVLLISALLPLMSSAAVEVCRLRTEGQVRPLNIEAPQPRLSWEMVSSARGVMQLSYRILVSSTPEKLAAGEGDLWDSGEVSSDCSVRVPYAGVPLVSNQRCFWKVRVRTTQGESPWSESGEWGMGLLGETHWSGRWIGWDAPFPWDREDSHSRLSSRYLRTEFTTRDRRMVRATVHVCGLGMYELFINGQRIGEQVLAPAPTDYRRTVLYNSFDVTEQLADRGAANAIGVTLGNGRFYTMRQHYKPYKIPTFGYPKLRLNLIIEYEDGTVQRIDSNEQWKLTAEGPLRSNNEYDGEVYDARRDLGDWAKPGYDDSKWIAAQRVSTPYGTLRGNSAPNMRVMRTLGVKSLQRFGDRWIADFGQNTAGWVRIRIRRGAAGDTIRMRYAEILKNEGTELDVENLRNSQSTDLYICSGKERNTLWSSRFSYHGFRYVEVSGCTELHPEDLTAEAVFDEMEENGSFSCSNETLNAILHNAWWGIASNYKGVPIDCPQRDERQPWLGDHAMGTWGESFLFGNESFYAKWMNDIREAQREDGCIPDICPAYYNYYTSEMTWSSTLPVVCDMLYEQYGNDEPIRRNYEAVKRWMHHIRSEFTTAEGIISADKYGDWCVPPESPELIHSMDPARKTDGRLIATAYYCKVAQLLSKFARIQGLEADAAYYDREAAEVGKRFNEVFLTVRRGTSPVKKPHLLYPDSVYYGNNTVTSNLLPLAFDLVPEDCREEVAKRLITSIITTNGGHVSCGVIGVNWLFRELTRIGRGDVAYLLASNRSYPSYGYMVEKGATTIWELWNGDTANRRMNSRNHVMMLGDLLSWYFRDLAGMNPAAPGYKRILLRPDFSIENLEWVEASHRTPYGELVSKWRKTLTHIDWEVTVPCNTTAELVLPTPNPRALQEQGVSLVRQERNATVWSVPSGSYRFSVELDPTQGGKRPGVVEEQFLYEQAPFPECHAATIAETPQGDLVAAFFGGTKERNPDVCIWVCRKPKGTEAWSAPVQVADGVLDAEHRVACWNPVLFQLPGSQGELWLFYKVGPNVGGWKGYMLRSRDGGKTWSSPEALPEGFLGPSKNKPEYVDGRVICPSSTEGSQWRVHFEITEDMGKTWRKVGPLDAEMSVPTQLRKPGASFVEDMESGTAIEGEGAKPIYAIQPCLLKLSDGRLEMLCRTRNAKTGVSWSSDKGDTWSKLSLLELENNQSGIDAVTLRDGRHVVAYNDFETLPGTPKGARTPLSLAISDDGIHWRHWITLEDSPVSQYSYPAIIEGSDGFLHLVYTWRRQRIKYMRIELPR